MAREWRIERDGDDENRREERWLVTYADLITLLMIFFVVMYALSAKISAKNFERLAKSLNTSLTKKAKPPKAQDPFAPDVDPTDALQQESKILKKAIAPFKGRSQVMIDLTNKGLVISLADTSFFDLGSTDLKPDGKAALLSIAQSIATVSNAISVEGHTDNTPAGKSGVSNWVIGATRAANVAQYLSTVGKIPAKRFQVVSYAEYRPLFPNDSPEHKALNRRVDIVVQQNDPKPAITPKPESIPDTLAPTFGNDSLSGTPGKTTPGNEGNTVPNPFGNSF